MTQPENPPAFPSRHDVPVRGGGSYRDDRPGMSLRDWLAGMALQGMLANPHRQILSRLAAAAADAYLSADAMLAERAKDGAK
jgi:hypothetical protein